MKRPEREAASLTAILLAATHNVQHAVYFLTSTILVNIAKLVKWRGTWHEWERDTHKGLRWRDRKEM
jgi:hypothetical protein